MRNLKKFLALALAMVMAFSLMLTVNAANPVKTFDDAGNIEEKFVEAADVLTGMKVFQGDEGGFRPADTITRAEVAALIYRLATGDVDNNRAQLYANYGNFTDVAESDWFAGYVGYCANAGYIKGTSATTFDPYASVTGYETLAMILRAIGYDKNGEFTGATWQTNVSALATQLGILENIKTTHYGDTLYLASRRDVVAELLFQANAKVPMVTYTTAFGYQNTGMTGGVVGSTKNPTLGLYIFGLTNDTGVIVGNQETGERVTILGREGEKAYVGHDGTNSTGAQTATWTEYNYPGTPVVDGQNVTINAGRGSTGTNDIKVDNSLFLDYKSGINVFGYKTKFWYNGGENDGTKMGTRDNPRKVYASFDKHESDKLVYAKEADGSGSLTGSGAVGDANQSLGPVVKDAGMVVSDSSAIFNSAFDRFSASHKSGAAADTHVGATTTATITNGSAAYVYKIISNHTNVDDKDVLDVVIALNIQSSKINGVDNVSSFKYVSAPDFDDASVTPNAIKYLATANIHDSAIVTDLDTGFIAQAALVGDSTKTLGAYEIGWHITGTHSVDGTNTTAAPLKWGGRRDVGSAEKTAINKLTGGTAAEVSTAYYKLAAVGTKEGVVTTYHNHTADVPGTGYVVLNDGTKLEQSVLYNTVQEDATNSLFTIPQQKNVAATTAAAANNQGYGSMTYRFYLDAEGKYIGAEPIVGTEYVYGTYADFQSDLGTSSYTYRLVGVNLDGEQVTRDVKKLGTSAFNGTMNAIGNIAAIGVPYRGDALNDTGTGYSGVQAGVYGGYAVNSVGSMTTDTDNTNGTNLPVTVYDGADANFPASVDITKSDVALGAKLASTDGVFAKNNLYFTEKTKFIIVSGTGTDSQKVSVYNGISELLGANRKVTINFDATSQGAVADQAHSKIPYFTYNAKYVTMMDYTLSDFIYAQNNTDTAKQANVIFLPAAAVTGVGSSLYYVGNSTPLLVNAYGEDATKFAMYNDGKRGEYWIKGLVDSAKTNADRLGTATEVVFDKGAGATQTHDKFFNLTDTGLKATDGEPIYTVTEVTASYDGTSNRALDGIVIARPYIATTTDSQTAMIYKTIAGPAAPALYKVTGAKVVNLNADNTGSAKVWPGITDLATLNEASSLQNQNTIQRVQVSAVLSGDNLNAEVIYVCYDQAHT